MESILISACLLGCACRYDGRDNFNEAIHQLRQKYHVIIICPEVDGGLSVPRVPCEILGERVINRDGVDQTEKFLKGANIALNLAINHKVKFAILKAKSPSCGLGKVYDGTFSGILIDGDGVTTKLLKAHGIRVYNELNLGDIEWTAPTS